MNRKIRILYTISNLNTAGSGKVMRDLADGLDKRFFEVEIACGSSGGALHDEITDLGITVHVFKTKTSYRPYHSLIYRIWKISKFYRKHNYDIVHSWQWSNDWTEALAAKFAGIKWLYTKKAMGFGNRHWYIKSYLADFIITINEEMQQYFPNKKNQALIPIGIDTNFYNPVQFTHDENQSKDFKIITVANLVPVKGIEVLLFAMNELKIDNVKLLVLGYNQNKYGQKIKQLCEEMDLEKRVEFIGKVHDVRPYIASSDLFVIPTLNKGRKEGMPMALVEAMSMGVPVLGSNITGINFVLKDFENLLFEPGNSHHLADKINYIKNLTAEQRSVIGSSLRKYCKNHFSHKTFLLKHQQIYKALVSEADG